MLNQLFVEEWSEFEQLALLSYADTVHATQFGELPDLEAVHKFVREESKLSFLED